MLTRAEADALYEAMKSIFGARAPQMWLDCGIKVGWEGDPDVAPVARPRGVEPEDPGAPPGVHPGAESG